MLAYWGMLSIEFKYDLTYSELPWNPVKTFSLSCSSNSGSGFSKLGWLYNSIFKLTSKG